MSAPLFVNSYLVWADMSGQFLTNKTSPPSSKHVESLVQVEVEVTMEVASHKLMDLVFALCMQILELVQISLDIEPVRSENVWLPLDQVLTLHPRDLTRHRQLQPHSTTSLLSPDSGEHVGEVGAGPLYAVSVVNPSLPGLRVTVKPLQVVVEVHVPGTEVSPCEA